MKVRGFRSNRKATGAAKGETEMTKVIRHAVESRRISLIAQIAIYQRLPIQVPELVEWRKEVKELDKVLDGRSK